MRFNKFLYCKFCNDFYILDNNLYHACSYKNFILIFKFIIQKMQLCSSRIILLQIVSCKKYIFAYI